MHCLVSIEAGTGTEWEAALMAWSLRQAGMRDPLTVLSAAGPPGEPMGDADIFVTPSYAGADGGDYSVYNRLYGLWEWLQRAAPASATLLLLDPDMIALQAIPDLHPAPQRPILARYDNYLGALTDPAVRALTRRPDLFSYVGAPVPLWIRPDDLAALLPSWTEQTMRLRRYGLPDHHWIAEMAAFWLAVSDLGWAYDLVPAGGCSFLLHYYYGNCGVRFDKSRYRPWEPIAAASADASPVLAQASDLFNQYAALRRAGLA